MYSHGTEVLIDVSLQELMVAERPLNVTERHLRSAEFEPEIITFTPDRSAEGLKTK